MQIKFRWFIPFLMIAVFTSELHAEIKVFTSIKPIHSLAASVMEGIGTPDLLMSGNTTPHSFSFKPSDVRKVSNADLILWIGPELESSLVKLLSNVPQSKVHSILNWSGIDILPTRKGGIFDTKEDGKDSRDEENHHDGDGHHHHHQGERDPHIWLNPDNAVTITLKLADAFSRIDAENSETFSTNAKKTVQRIEQMKQEIAKELLAVQSRPFLVFHDAFHYFEESFGLNNLGAVSINPDKQPGARRVHSLRGLIEKQQVSTVFVEPQFSDKLSQSLVAGSQVKLEIIDPLGANIPDGPDAYFTMMRQLSKNILKGLAPQ